MLCIDRAGIVGNDGATHHGLLDLAYLRPIPNMQICAPMTGEDLKQMLILAEKLEGPIAIRYPRGNGSGKRTSNRLVPLKNRSGEMMLEGKSKIMVVGIGIMTVFAMKAAEILKKDGIEPFVYDLKFVKPLPEELFMLIKKHGITGIVTVEDGIAAGGAGSALLEELSRRKMETKCMILGVRDNFSTHGTQAELRKAEGIDAESIAAAVKNSL